jgi:hypothetical protein
VALRLDAPHTLVNDTTLEAMWMSQKDPRRRRHRLNGFGIGVQMRKDGKNVSQQRQTSRTPRA